MFGPLRYLLGFGALVALLGGCQVTFDPRDTVPPYLQVKVLLM